MQISTEKTNDFHEIYNFIETAFQTADVADGTEQDFAHRLRSSAKYVPELALVGRKNDQLVAHIMLTKFPFVSGTVSDTKGLLLAPLSVKNGFRKQYLGTKITHAALDAAKKLGYEYVILVGDPQYYKRFGFVEAVKKGISATGDAIPSMYVQVKELLPGVLQKYQGETFSFEE